MENNQMIEMRWIRSDEGDDLGYTLQYRQMKNVQLYYVSDSTETCKGLEWSEWRDVPIIDIKMPK